MKNYYIKLLFFFYFIFSIIIINTFPVLNHQLIKLNDFEANAVGSSTEYVNLQINGDKIFVENTLKSLELLRLKSKENFDVVQKYIGRIAQGNSSGMAAYEDIPTFYVGKPTSDASTTWYASAIAHDSYHSKLYHDYKEVYGRVPANVWGGYDAEMKCLEYQISVLERIGSSKSEIDYAKSLRGTNW